MSYVAHSYDLGKVAHRLLLDHINAGITITHQERQGGLYGAEFNGSVTINGIHDWTDVATYELFYDEAEKFARTLTNFVAEGQTKRMGERTRTS